MSTPEQTRRLDSCYIDGLTYRLVEALTNQGVDGERYRPVIRQEVADVLCEIQHRLYQYVAADLLDIAHQINPDSARSPKK